MNAADIILEGLQQGLAEASANLYRVFTAADRNEDHEEKFLRGVEKHRADYERMAELVMQRMVKL